MEKLFSRIDRIKDPLGRTASFEVHAGEADRGVAPEVDAKFIRFRQLRAHGEAEAHAKLRGLAPTDVRHWLRRYPEWRDLIAPDCRHRA